MPSLGYKGSKEVALNTSKRKASLQQIPIEQLTRGKYQPREHFDPEKLQELANSIKTTNGLLQPVVVRSIGEGRYEIIAGERRWRAAQLAGLTDISCLVCHYTNEQALQATIIENINRTDLNPIEEAKSYQRLVEEFDYLHEEIAESVGKSRTAITNSLRLLKLDPAVQAYLIHGQLTEGHGKILASLPPHKQKELATLCVHKSWNVRKLEAAIKKLDLPEEGNKGPYSDANILHLEIKLSEHLGNRVRIECEERGGGVVLIRFNNIDELEGHFERLGFNYEGNL